MKFNLFLHIEKHHMNDYTYIELFNSCVINSNSKTQDYIRLNELKDFIACCISGYLLENYIQI